jgi:hypothetical protein
VVVEDACCVSMEDSEASTKNGVARLVALVGSHLNPSPLCWVRALLEAFSPRSARHALLQEQLDAVIRLAEGRLRARDHPDPDPGTAQNTTGS